MSDALKGVLLALAGIVILSPDTLLVRLLDLPQWTLQFYRGFGTLVGLSVGMAVLYRREVAPLFRAVGWRGVVAGLCYTMASLLFVSALYHTTVANTLAIISIAPIFGALMTRFLLKDQLPLRTWVAAAFSLGAIGIILGGDLSAGAEYWFGDLLALLQALFMAASFILVRSRSEVNMVPCMAIGGFFMCLVALPLAPTLTVEAAKWPLLGMLILGVIPASFTLLVTASRYISAPEVNMIMLLEMIFGPFLVWAIVDEGVAPTTLLGGGLLLAVLLGHSLLSVRRL